MAVRMTDKAQLVRPTLYSACNPFREAVDLDCSYNLETGELLPSKTRQEFADECDLNQLMERYESGRTSIPPLPGEPQYFDTTLFTTDFREAMDMMNHAENAFMRLPAQVRKEFDNDPQKFVAYALDENNGEQMVKWGLAEIQEPPAPQKVEIVNPPAPAQEPAKT